MTKYAYLLAFGLLAASCSNKQKAGQSQAKAMPYPVIEIPARTITGETTYPVRVQGVVNSEVYAKISGYITQVLVDEGQKVHKGQLLFRLETHILTQDAKAAKADVDAAQVGVNQLIPLVKQNIISKVQLETAKAKLEQAKSNYNSIIANIGYADITSPIDGFVGAINFRQGNLVGPSSTTPITVISQTNDVYVYFSMNEADYLNFLQETPGQTLSDKIQHFPNVKLQLANGETYSHEGKITNVTAQVDPSTGTVSFRATFPNPEHLIANGSSGTILIPKAFKNAIVVPSQSTFDQQGKTYVYQVMDNNTVNLQMITTAQTVNNLLVVSSGLKAGDKIVGQGAENLHNKEQIKPIVTPFDSVASLKQVFQ